jgi:hypothetical protein
VNICRLAGWLFAVILIPLQSVMARLSDDDMVLGVTTDMESSTPVIQLRPKPATFDSLQDRIDFIHENLQLSLQRHVVALDTIGDDGTYQRVDTPPSRFRITPYFVAKQDSGVDFSFEPDFEVEIELPNLERRWRVFLESSRGDDLPGIDPSERDQSGQIGIRSVRKYFRTDVGVKFRWPPVAFVRTEWRTMWSVRHTVVQPRFRLYYESDEGFGNLTSITVHRWFGREKNMYWQSVSAGKANTRETDGVEWEQTLKLALVRQILEGKVSWRRVVNVQDVARGHQLRYSLFSNTENGSTDINRHRLTYTYRKPLYKKWVYLEVAPGVEAANDEDWDVIPKISVGFDMLFWGTYER